MTKLADESGFFYLLPGGGQEAGEKLQDCLVRECREETGYEIEVHDLLFVRECFKDEGIHRIEFIFKAELVNLKHKVPFNRDDAQVGVEWISLENVLNEPLFPVELRQRIAVAYKEGRQERVYIGEIE
ncbi:NUDIX domain-containing protein [Paenibacillus sp. NPDC056579]|uniref:NUDIX domain-containing protein n=1 Tax=Paenibacillus sp. NPDC056579 TaxID=3345871 RepID=UPI0036C69EC5